MLFGDHIAFEGSTSSPPKKKKSDGNMDPFHPGDIVRLKSGGPLMGVVEVDGEAVRCRWHDKDGMHDRVFTEAELERPADGGQNSN